MTDEPTNTPEPLPTPEGDEQVWDEIEAKEDGEETSVEVSEQELADLGEFLTAIQQVLINLQERLLAVEAFLAEVFAGAVEQAEVEAGEGEGGSAEATGYAPKLSIVDGSGNPIESAGTEATESDQ